MALELEEDMPGSLEKMTLEQIRVGMEELPLPDHENFHSEILKDLMEHSKRRGEERKKGVSENKLPKYSSGFHTTTNRLYEVDTIAKELGSRAKY